MFEKLIKIRILNFLNKNKILKTCNFGFRESTSTTDSLLYCTGYLQTNNDKHCAAGSIYIKKACDSLDHSILLEQLYLYGFRGLSDDFIRSYLTNRNQYDHFNSSISSTSHIKYGISQGSVLGHIVFLSFIYDYQTYNILVILHFLKMIQLLPSLIHIFPTLKILLMTLYLLFMNGYVITDYT